MKENYTSINRDYFPVNLPVNSPVKGCNFAVLCFSSVITRSFTYSASVSGSTVVEHDKYLREMFLTRPIHFIVRYNDKFYTNVLFTNELRYILYKMKTGRYNFTFLMCTTKGIYKQVFEESKNVGIFTKRDALELSSRLAEAVYGRFCIDRTQPVKLWIENIG